MNTKISIINPYFISFSLTAFLHPGLFADQIANSSIDLKKDVESVEQQNFQNKNNLEAPINNIDSDKEIKNKAGEKTIFLNSIDISGNKKYSTKELYKFFKQLIGKNVTFNQLQNAAFKAQSIYRENGYITTRVVLPKQDFLKGEIKVIVLESYLENIVVRGGTEGTRKYIKFMTNKVLEDNQKNKIFNFSDLERQLLLIKKNNIGQLTSTLSKGSKLGTSLLTIVIDPNPTQISAFSNTDISDNLGDFVVGLKSSYTTKSENPLKIGLSTKYAAPSDLPRENHLSSGVVYLEKPIGQQGLSLNTIYAFSSTRTKDLFPLTAGKSQNKGYSEYVSFGASYPFILRRNTEFGVDVSTSIQDSKQDLFQNDVYSNNVSTDKIRTLRVGLNARKSLRNSYNTARFVYSQGYDGFDNYYKSGEIKSNREASSNFSSYKLNLTRQQNLGRRGLSLLLNTSAQLSTEPLPTPEKFSFGGSQFGRGFKNSHIFGDAGWSASLQLTQNIYNKNGKSLSPFVWFDYGEVDDLTGETRELSASTYGIGIGGNLSSNTTYKVSVAVPSEDDSNPAKVGIDHSIVKFDFGLKF